MDKLLRACRFESCPGHRLNFRSVSRLWKTELRASILGFFCQPAGSRSQFSLNLVFRRVTPFRSSTERFQRVRGIRRADPGETGVFADSKRSSLREFSDPIVEQPCVPRTTFCQSRTVCGRLPKGRTDCHRARRFAQSKAARRKAREPTGAKAGIAQGHFFWRSRVQAMSSRPATEIRVLAIDPASRGFGFAVLEKPSTLVDWGVKGVRRDKHAGCLAKVAELIDYYQPDVIALEDCSKNDCRRSERIQRLIQGIIRLAVGRKIKVRKVSRVQVRGAFSLSNEATKHEIACLIARLFPELASRLPPRRRPWMSEDSRMQMFNAIALGLTLFGWNR